MLSLKTALAILLVPGAACFLVPYWILAASPVPLARPVGILQGLAVLVAFVGVYMILWVGAAFVRQGRGTPVPVEPPKNLVIHGLYRVVRNPMYVGAILIILAEAAYFASLYLLMYAAGVWAVLHTFLVVFEEPQLKRRFGPNYERYLAEVPRWIPKWPAPHRPGA
jgi:protein-S-isoprenylcysteine O-methyltransferase Ste14